MLTVAVLRLTNVCKLHIMWGDGHTQSKRFNNPYGAPSISQRTSVYLAAIGLTACNLQELIVDQGRPTLPGVALQDMPVIFSQRFSSLTKLESS